MSVDRDLGGYRVGWRSTVIAMAIAGTLSWASPFVSRTRAQAAPAVDRPPATVGGPESARTPGALDHVAEAAPAEQAARLVFHNRTITVLRARLLSNLPARRAAGAATRLHDLVEQGVIGPVARRVGMGFVSLTVAGQDVFTIFPADVDELAGETLDGKSHAAMEQLRRALAEADEARSPERLLRGALFAGGATAVALLLVAALARVHRRLSAWLVGKAQEQLRKQLQRVPAGDLWLRSEVRGLRVVRRTIAVGLGVSVLLVAYWWLAFVLRQFPYTRPWSEALRGFLVDTVSTLGRGIIAAIPGLVTVALIVFITRALARGVQALFREVEAGRVTIPWLHAETAPPTRRLVVALLWIFAVVVAYPYLPGSQSEAFKGVSVLLGLMISLGSSGFVNQVMSSFMITYPRSLRVGDFVRIGDIEGTVAHLGVLSTKVRTPRNEEVTIPNAVVASTVTTNFSRHAEEGVFARTSVTIGYDTPWRQVAALLVLAAERIPGVRPTPVPYVLQTALEDFYVEYTLAVAPDPARPRFRVMSDLHAQILDVFNEHGVQIMSPHYEADTAHPKVVPRETWHSLPAKSAGGGAGLDQVVRLPE